jgi:iron complex outermembrane receptor protein
MIIKNIISILLSIILFFSVIGPVYSQKKPEKIIYLGNFFPYKSKKSDSINKQILSSLKKDLEEKEYTVKITNISKSGEIPEKSLPKDAHLYISGFYQADPRERVHSVYGLIYNPQTGTVIDGFHSSGLLYDISEDEKAKMDEKLIEYSSKKLLEDFIKRVLQRVLANPNRKVRTDNYTDILKLRNLLKQEHLFPLTTKEQIREAREQVFRLFEEVSVVTTAGKKEQTITDAPSIISAFTRSDMEKMGVTSLIDLLRFIPGIETSMGLNGHYRVAIRGSRKDGIVLVLINGLHINDFYNGRPILDLPVEFIERIEVIRGPGSALYGTNAVAGVINIFTVKNENSITLRGGTNWFFQTNVNYGLKQEDDKLNVSASAGYKSTNGANADIKHDLFGERPDAKKWDLTWGDKTGRTNRFLRDGYFQTYLNYKNLNIDAFGIFRNQGSWVGPAYFVAPDSDFKTNQILCDVYYKFQITNILFITPKIYGNLLMHNYLMQYAPDGYQYSALSDEFTDGKMVKEKYNNLNLGSDVQVNYNITKKLDIITGIVYENLSMADYDLTRNYQIVGEKYKEKFANYDGVTFKQEDKSRGIWAYYLQGNYRMGIVGLTSGLRYDNYSDFGQSLNPRAGIVFKPLRELSFKALYGQAFRAPTFQELYDTSSPPMDHTAVMGNTKLEAETARTAELGLEILYWKFILRANGFYNQSDNLIGIYDPEGWGGIGTYENIGDTESFGGETELIFFITKTINLFVNYSYVKTHFFSNPNLELYERSKKYDWYDNELKNMPGVRINGGFNFNIFNFIGFLGATYGNESENNSRTYLEASRQYETRIPSYMLFNFSLAYNIDKNFIVRIAGNNISILGTRYADPEESTALHVLGKNGMAQPTETFLLSLIYKF